MDAQEPTTSGAPRRVAFWSMPPEPRSEYPLGLQKDLKMPGSTEKAALENSIYAEELVGVEYDKEGYVVTPDLSERNHDPPMFTIDSVPELATEPYAAMKEAIQMICLYFTPAEHDPARRVRSAPSNRGALDEKKSPGITEWKEKLIVELERHGHNGLRSDFRHKIFHIIQTRFCYQSIDSVKDRFPGGRYYEKSCAKK